MYYHGAKIQKINYMRKSSRNFVDFSTSSLERCTGNDECIAEWCVTYPEIPLAGDCRVEAGGVDITDFNNAAAR